MEIENTTILSTIVGLAGFLAEFIFRDALTGSVAGVIMSVILAAIILFCAFFALDGLSQSLASVRKKEENRKREYDEKVFRLLNRRLSEIVKFQKATYATLVKGKAKVAETTTTSEDEPDPWTQLAEDIGESTLKAAKLTAKYNQKQQEKSDQLLEQSAEEILRAVSSISDRLQEIADEIEEIKNHPPVVDVKMPAGVMVGQTVEADSPAGLPEEISAPEVEEPEEVPVPGESDMLNEDIIPPEEEEEEVDPLLEALAMEGEQLLAAVTDESEEESEEDFLASLNIPSEEDQPPEMTEASIPSEEETEAPSEEISGESEEDLLASLDALLKEEGSAVPSEAEESQIIQEAGMTEASILSEEPETPSEEIPGESEEDILASLDALLKEEEPVSVVSDVDADILASLGAAPENDAAEPELPEEPEGPTAIDLLAQKQKDEATKADEEAAASAQKTPVESDNPNKQLSPEEIAALFASSAPEPQPAAAPEPKPVNAAPKPQPAPEPKPVNAAPKPQPAAVPEPKPVNAVPEPPKTPEPAKAAAPEPPKAEPAPAVSEDPNKMMSPDDIAALIASMK